MGTEQERMAVPLICTVQAPHCAIPQPNFVPVKPITSRNTQRSGVSGSMSISRDVPLISIVTTTLSNCFKCLACPAGVDCGYAGNAFVGRDRLSTPLLTNSL